MFITAKVENPQGEVLDLMSKRGSFFVEHIDGLAPPTAIINTNNIYGMDGAKLNSHYLGTRNIVLTMQLRGDQEASRQELYKFMNSNVPLRFYFKNQNRDVYIDGIVENIEDDMFVRTQSMQASIICPDPFFRDVELQTIELQDVKSLFEFPFSINQNDPVPISDRKNGRITDVSVNANVNIPWELDVEIPTGSEVYQAKFVIDNHETGEFLGFQNGGFRFSDGDRLYINTDPRNLKFYVIHDGEYVNMFSKLNPGSTFFQLHPGNNQLEYAASDTYKHMKITMTYNNLYTGV